LLEGIKVLVLSDYGKGALKNHQALIQAPGPQHSGAGRSQGQGLRFTVAPA
jgi:hypothetical protein